jgi:hypothetical protein
VVDVATVQKRMDSSTTQQPEGAGMSDQPPRSVSEG